MYLSYYEKEDNLNVNFLYSPFHELLASLHVLSKPEHHGSREEWAKKMMGNLSNDMIQKLMLFTSVSSDFLGIMGFLEDKRLWDMSISECLNEIEHIRDTRFLNEVFNNEVKEEFIINAINNGYIHKSISEKYKQFLNNPYEFKKNLTAFLREYYFNYFVSEVSFSEPILIRKLKREYERCKGMSVYDYINSLHPRIEVTDEKVNFHKYKLFEVYKKDLKEVVLIVDSFTIPHLLIGLPDNFKSIKLIVPTYITSYDDNKLPEDTLSILKGIADETRMQIIRNLHKQPMSTQKLADKLNLTEACISKHLKILYKASIVTKIRDGNYMNYHLNQRVIDSLMLYIYEYIS